MPAPSTRGQGKAHARCSFTPIGSCPRNWAMRTRKLYPIRSARSTNSAAICGGQSSSAVRETSSTSAGSVRPGAQGIARCLGIGRPI
jgi:hypothetical protein